VHVNPQLLPIRISVRKYTLQAHPQNLTASARNDLKPLLAAH
jgi:hypothetical protein